MAENAGGKQPGRGPGKRFQAGQSGNPAGKPKGARSRAAILSERLMRDDEQAIVEAVIGAAKGGDMTAARLILERIAPVRKGRPIMLNLPATETAADVNAAMTAVVAQMAAGEITPDEAGTVVAVIEAKRKAIETDELDRRLREVEGKLENRK